ncbi:MAG TPA: hypothetical protein VGJ20_24075 [Xanthobacteraceae bacterium]
MTSPASPLSLFYPHARRAALLLTLVLLPGCSDLAQSQEDAPSATQPPYPSLVANYLKSSVKNAASYDALEISELRWVHSTKGWTWLACVRFQDHGHLRTYALFLDDHAIVDGRYAVEVDACDAQTYAPFDLASGAIGRSARSELAPLH